MDDSGGFAYTRTKKAEKIMCLDFKELVNIMTTNDGWWCKIHGSDHYRKCSYANMHTQCAPVAWICCKTDQYSYDVTVTLNSEISLHGKEVANSPCSGEAILAGT